jgi:hypothetical protein
MTANIVFSVFNPALRERPRGRLLGSGNPLVFAPFAALERKSKSAAVSRA